MGFYINETVTTELSYKEITLIGVATNVYLDACGENIDKEVKEILLLMLSRLNREMYNHPDNDKPNGH